jgi:competence protein CoiA
MEQEISTAYNWEVLTEWSGSTFDPYREKPPALIRGSEGEEHFAVKSAVYEYLWYSTKCKDVEAEKKFGQVRADVYAVINEIQVAVEVQRSNINTAELFEKFSIYKELNIYVLYILPRFPQYKHSRECVASEWQRFLHAMYYGQLCIMHPFSCPAMSLVRLEPATRYNEHVGYTYNLKSRRTSKIYDKTVWLDMDFKGVTRPAGKIGRFYLPECLIYQPKVFQWWKQK